MQGLLAPGYRRGGPLGLYVAHSISCTVLIKYENGMVKSGIQQVFDTINALRF